MQDWAVAGRLHHRARRYRRGDLRGAHLVLNTVRSDAALCRRVYAQALRRRIPINTFDLPRYSTVAMAALVSCGHLRVSISTSNAAPALASRLRRDLEAILLAEATAPVTDPAGADRQDPPVSELEQFLEALAQVRSLARRRVASAAERRTLLRGLVDEVRLNGAVQLPPEWRRRLAAAHAELERHPNRSA